MRLGLSTDAALPYNCNSILNKTYVHTQQDVPVALRSPTLRVLLDSTSTSRTNRRLVKIDWQKVKQRSREHAGEYQRSLGCNHA